MWGPWHASPVTGAPPISWQGLWWAVPSQFTEEEAEVLRGQVTGQRSLSWDWEEKTPTWGPSDSKARALS